MKRYATAKGYTLVELLVTLAIAGLIGGAILGVYQVSQNVYIRASSLEAAQLGARAGLDRMANELRLIGSYWVGAASNTDPTAIINPQPTSITFMANVDDLSIVGGAEATVCSGCTASGASVPLSLTTTATTEAFNVYADTTLNDYIYIANGARREVRQIAGTTIGSNTLPLASALSSSYPAGSLVRDVKRITYAINNNALTRTQGNSGAIALVDNVSGLTFRYFDAAGAELVASPLVAIIREIQIDIRVQSPDGSQRLMTTRVRPRNLP